MFQMDAARAGGCSLLNKQIIPYGIGLSLGLPQPSGHPGPRSDFIGDRYAPLLRTRSWNPPRQPVRTGCFEQACSTKLLVGHKWHLTDLKREHLIDQLCVQEIIPPEKE